MGREAEQTFDYVKSAGLHPASTRREKRKRQSDRLKFADPCRVILASTRLPCDSVCLLLPLSSVSQGSFSFYRLSTYLGLSLRGIPHWL